MDKTRNCKDCLYFSCNYIKRCQDCEVSDYGCQRCHCVSVNFDADMCIFYKRRNENGQGTQEDNE